jgi:hypothetical protein
VRRNEIIDVPAVLLDAGDQQSGELVGEQNLTIGDVGGRHRLRLGLVQQDERAFAGVRTLVFVADRSGPACHVAQTRVM